MKRSLRMMAVAALLCTLTTAQEESVNPGINDNFVDPDVDPHLREDGEPVVDVLEDREGQLAALPAVRRRGVFADDEDVEVVDHWPGVGERP